MTAQALYTYGPSLVGAALILTVLLLGGKMHFLDRRDGARLDFLAGIAAAYVFVDILPHLAQKQAKFFKLGDEGLSGFLQHHIYILALAGFLIYLGVLLADERQRKSLTVSGVTLANAPLPVKISTVSLAGYTLVIGCMLAQQPSHRIEPPLIFAAAMAGHFTGLCRLFYHRWPTLYDGAGRYLFGLGLLGGWLLGLFFELSGVLYAASFAFLAGGIIVVTMIFELPRITSPKRYWSFCGGAATFTLAMLLLESVHLLD